jgi:hypothetical protein
MRRANAGPGGRVMTAGEPLQATLSCRAVARGCFRRRSRAGIGQTAPASGFTETK